MRGIVGCALEQPFSGYLPPDQYGEALEDPVQELNDIGAEVGMEKLVDRDLEACTVVTETSRW